MRDPERLGDLGGHDLPGARQFIEDELVALRRQRGRADGVAVGAETITWFFATRSTVDEALAWVDAHTAPLSGETVPVRRLDQLLGRPARVTDPCRGLLVLVEDEDMVRAVAERALTRQGYVVVTASDGEQGLEVLDELDHVDLLLSDVVMPNMDGPAMERRARAKRPDLPVLFMSGYAEEQLRKSIDMDNVSFLPKPFSVAQLSEAVAETFASTVQNRAEP